MGHYTSFRCRFKLRPDTPEQILNTIRYIFAPIPMRYGDLAELPDHPFFKCDRWSSVGILMEVRANWGNQKNTLEQLPNGRWVVEMKHASIKNYGDEFYNFLKWLMPYMAGKVGKFVGESVSDSGFHRSYYVELP